MKQVILKKQALNDNIMILWEGAVVVEVCRTDPSTLDRQRVWFENINRGACFNVFCAFSQNMAPLVDYVVLSKECTILAIKVSDLYQLSKRHPDLADKLKKLQLKVDGEQVDCLDVFRFQNKYLRLDTYRSE